MFRKRKSIPKKYVLMMVIILIIIILVIFSFTLKRERKLNKVEAFFKDGLIYTEKIITYPFNYIKNVVGDYKELKNIKKDNDILETSTSRIPYSSSSV